MAATTYTPNRSVKKGKSTDELKKLELVVDNKSADIKADKQQNLRLMILLDVIYNNLFTNSCQ